MEVEGEIDVRNEANLGRKIEMQAEVAVSADVQCETDADADAKSEVESEIEVEAEVEAVREGLAAHHHRFWILRSKRWRFG